MSDLKLEDIIKVNDTSKVTGDISAERMIAMHAIMNTDFLSKMHSKFSEVHLFSSVMVRIILKWCTEYYTDCNAAPRTDIQGIFEQRASKLTGSQATDISDFLGSLSEEYTKKGALNNAEFEARNAEKYMNTQRVNQMLKKAGRAMSKGDIAKAEQEISNYSRPAEDSVGATDIHKDYSRFRRKKNKDNVLFEYPNKNFAEMFGPVCRQHFSLYGAPSKVGKSRAIVRSAVEAFRNGLNVLICTLEMSKDEMASLVDDELLRAGMKDGTAFIPVFKGEGADTRVVFEEQIREALSPEEMEELSEAHKFFNPGCIYIREWQQKVMTVEGHLKPEMDYIRKHFGVVFDYIGIDYIDLMGIPEDKKNIEERHQINHKYQAAKALAQTANAHVNGATQTDNEGKVREDYRKVNEINCYISILCTPEEKRCGVYQYRCLANRHVPFDIERVLIGLTNHGVGLAGLDFRWFSDEWDEWLPEVSDDFELFVDDYGIDYGNMYNPMDDLDIVVTNM
jgi:hypothetical protein